MGFEQILAGSNSQGPTQSTRTHATTISTVGGAAGFGLGMSRPEIFHVDRRQRFGEGCAELFSLDQCGDFVEKLP
jgi:hypothetical protein